MLLQVPSFGMKPDPRPMPESGTALYGLMLRNIL
jgi:hypothetical protein